MIAAYTFITIALATSPRDEARELAYGDADKGWVLVNSQTHSITQINFPGGRPTEVSVSSDGKRFAFTVRYSDSPYDQLFYWDSESGSSPRMIGESYGYHATPFLDDRNGWVYFAHHPRGGPPGKHAEREYARVYRVRTKGGEIEILSKGEGCRFAPNVESDRMLFIHSSCRLGYRLAILELRHHRLRYLTGDSEQVAEPTLSQDGRHALVEVVKLRTIEIREYDTTTGKHRTLFSLPNRGVPVRPQYGRNREVMYESEGAIWRWDGTPHRIHEFARDG